MLALEDDCEPDFIHGLTGDGITGLGNWILTDTKVWDDGNGPALYVTGRMDSIDGVPVTNIAKWDGTSWSSLGNGVGEPGTSQMAWAMEVFDDGTGEKLYVGGSFAHASNVPGTMRVAKWDGTQWLPGGSEGTLMNGPVYCFTVGNLGQGPRIFAAGGGGATVRVWESDGGTFSYLPGTFSNSANIWAMQVFNVSGSPYLYVGGYFSSVTGVSNAVNLVRWNGSAWQHAGNTDQFGEVRSMTLHDDGDGVALYIGGLFASVGNGTPANRVARLKQVGPTLQWSALGSGLTGWPGCGTCKTTISGLASFDDGDGPALYAVGNYTLAGGIDAPSIAKWKDNQWHALPDSEPAGGHGTTVPHFRTLAVHDTCGPLTENDSPALFVGGHFTTVGGTPDHYITMFQGCGDIPTCDMSFGDFNCDGAVDVSDLLTLLAAWGSCTSSCNCLPDLNGDGVVDVTDLLLLLSNWG